MIPIAGKGFHGNLGRFSLIKIEGSSIVFKAGFS